MRQNPEAVIDHLLVVDDVEDMLFATTQMFLGFAKEVHKAQGADEALTIIRRIAKEHTGLVVMTDLQMGVRTGVDLLKAVAAEGLPIAGAILMSGLPDFRDEIADVALSLGERNIPVFGLEKPFNKHQALCCLHRIRVFGDAQEITVSDAPFESSKKQGVKQVSYLFKSGYLLRQARRTLGLQISEVIEVLRSLGHVIDAKEYDLFEKSHGGSDEVPMDMWYMLCRLYEIPTDSITIGYNRELHLGRVWSAIQDRSFRFTASEALKRQIVELESTSRCTDGDLDTDRKICPGDTDGEE